MQAKCGGIRQLLSDHNYANDIRYELITCHIIMGIITIIISSGRVEVESMSVNTSLRRTKTVISSKKIHKKNEDCDLIEKKAYNLIIVFIVSIVFVLPCAD